jgi:hypothetical protein
MSTDICISFDTTGSMRPAILECKRKLTEMLDKLFSNIPDLRIGMISHGDYCDGDNAIHKIELTNDKTALKFFVEHAPNTDGGDGDEFYEFILHIAQDFDWKADNKVFMLIADAQPHRVGYRYDGSTYHFDWKEEAQKLANLGVNIYSIQALGRYDPLNFYPQLASFSNGRKLNLNQFTDAVETIISVCYHKIGKLEDYKNELEANFKMNRSLAQLFNDLDKNIKVTDTRYVGKDSSGLIPVPPARFQVLNVDHDIDIKSFVLMQGIRFHTGRGFYQFMKAETIQEHKEVILRNKLTGDMFTGAEARNFIGLPFGERGKIRPKLFEDYEVYVQSTSSNRKLIGGYKFLYENEL